ncbi:MAG: SAM hydrolase/SAM-dependent halogenase family protein [Thermodesulfobacteriota bacterium]
MKKPIITLLTDFGSRDPYVASMKGVMLSINSQCILIDITHQVKPHDIREGAFTLAQAYASFPKGTIHLAVVDPGVGGPRRPLLFVTKNYFFVGPDNGLLTIALRAEILSQVIVLTNQKYFLPKISSTFHGRDIFAPVAAHLSLGVKPPSFGPSIKSWQTLSFPGARMTQGKLIGEIVHVDVFGNLVTNIDSKSLFQFAHGRPFVIKAGKRIIRGLKEGYWEGSVGEAMAVIGSAGFLEIAIREGNAQRILRIKRGDQIMVSS